jgi:hypothetical protein
MQILNVGTKKLVKLELLESWDIYLTIYTVAIWNSSISEGVIALCQHFTKMYNTV